MKFGFIGFEAFKKDEEERAKKAVAMMIWLWLNTMFLSNMRKGVLNLMQKLHILQRVSL